LPLILSPIVRFLRWPRVAERQCPSLTRRSSASFPDACYA